MPKFSIIVPVYNVAPYLRECLDSVLHQTFNDWECLCVNDGSKDESGAILDEYARKDKRFRVFHKSNGGVSSARNLALDYIQGEWVAFLDSDDLWHFKTLELLSQVIVSCTNVEVVKFKSKMFNDGELVEWENCDSSKMSIIDISQEITFSAEIFTFANRIYHSSLLANLRFKQYTLGEDLLFLMTVLLKIETQHCLDKILYAYRLREESAVHSKITKEKVLDTIYFIREMFLLFSKSLKQIHPGVIKSFTNKYVEQTYVFIKKLSKMEQKYVLKSWEDGLFEIKQMNILKGFQFWRLKLLHILTFNWVKFSLCFLPYWLKVKGFHR